MSFSATLDLSGNKFRVLNFDIQFMQSIDQNGEPNSRPRGGTFNIVVEASKSNEFFEWMVKSDMKKSGKIVFNRRDTDSEMQKIEFKNAYCISFREVFDFSDDNPMIISAQISAQEISINSEKYTANWNNAGSGEGASSSSNPPPMGVNSFIAD